MTKPAFSPRVLIVVLFAALMTAGAVLVTGVLRTGHDVGGRGVTTSGKTLIGGAFELTDHTGKRVTDKTYAGKHMLVYFGFTFCPDVCPTELQIMAEALDLLGKDADRIAPLLISVDPDRDTVEQMATYVAAFHERIIGLTGSHEDIAKAAKAYRAYYAKVTDEGSEGGYSMDHSAFVYLMDDKGAFLTHFNYGTPAKTMAEKIGEYLAKSGATS